MALKRCQPVVEAGGVYYIRADILMNPVCAILDGLGVHVFPNRPEVCYLTVDDAADWCDRESLLADGDEERMNWLRLHQEQFAGLKAAIADGSIENYRGKKPGQETEPG